MTHPIIPAEIPGVELESDCGPIHAVEPVGPPDKDQDMAKITADAAANAGLELCTGVPRQTTGVEKNQIKVIDPLTRMMTKMMRRMTLI